VLTEGGRRVGQGCCRVQCTADDCRARWGNGRKPLLLRKPALCRYIGDSLARWLCDSLCVRKVHVYELMLSSGTFKWNFYWSWRMPSSETWRLVDLVWSDVSEERISCIFRVEKPASEEPAWAGGCSHTRSTRRHILEDGILHSHRHENLKSCLLELLNLGN
jgi:hypothetical protein